MQKYFENIETLHRFTLELDCHADDLQCEKCFSTGHFVSHGFLYKAQHQGEKQTVGKRIFCSNRFGRAGCGGTCRLYLAERIPQLHYASRHLFVFIQQLIAGCSICNAYQQATAAADPRHGYRWLTRLRGNLLAYRSWLPLAKRHEKSGSFHQRTERLQHLLPTLQTLLHRNEEESLCFCPCAQMQWQRQQEFF